MTEARINHCNASFQQIEEATTFIRNHFEIRNSPKVAIVLGSGLGGFAKQLKPVSIKHTLAYKDIPHFPTSSIEGHCGELHYGSISGHPIVVMQGRVHQYEGYSAQEVVFPIRVLAALGVKAVILTNASGAINLKFAAGDLMLISDHINMTGSNPLVGPNDERIGPRFSDMTEAYAKKLRAIALSEAKLQSIDLHEGCYFGVLGPCYETPAEIRMMRSCGADTVGMSTVLETIAARHAGLEVLGISCLTNMAAGIESKTLDHSDVTLTAKRAEDKFTKLLLSVIPKISDETNRS